LVQVRLEPAKKKTEQFYFGAWADDPKGERAMTDPVSGWLVRRDAIKAGIDSVRVQTGRAEMTLSELMAHFLSFKRNKVTSGELSLATLDGYLKEVFRRVGHLWKKTRQMLLRIGSLKHNRLALAKKGEHSLVFITRHGLSFYRETEIFGWVEVDGRKVKKLLNIQVDNPILRTFRRMC
jgi:hypothetical protein